MSDHKPLDRQTLPLTTPPCNAPLCPAATLALGCVLCRCVTGPQHYRFGRDAACCLDAGARREKVRALAMSDGRRAAALAAHFGLPRDCCYLD